MWTKERSERIRNNGMLRHSLRGEEFVFSLKHFIAIALDLKPYLQAWVRRDCNKGIKFKKGAINCCKEGAMKQGRGTRITIKVFNLTHLHVLCAGMVYINFHFLSWKKIEKLIYGLKINTH